MIKNIPVNKNLSLKGCWEMVNRVDTFEKMHIANQWLNNTVAVNQGKGKDMYKVLVTIQYDGKDWKAPIIYARYKDEFNLNMSAYLKAHFTRECRKHLTYRVDAVIAD